jgi:hypothetical protein
MTAPRNKQDELTSMEPIIQPELARQMILLRQRNGQPKRMTNETVRAVSELLRLFVIEAHSRASIEVSIYLPSCIYGRTTVGKASAIELPILNIAMMIIFLLMSTFSMLHSFFTGRMRQ